jgi:hypothetical protein
MGVQIWSDTEPFGLVLHLSPPTIWLPSSLGIDDIPLMDIATKAYNSKGSAFINRCQLFLQVISLYDILSYDLMDIHPSFKQGERPPLHQPTIHWLDFPRPPKNYWQLWYHFLHMHV